MEFQSSPQPLTAAERKTIADNTIIGIANVVAAHCQNAPINEIINFLRAKTIDNVTGHRLEILCEMMPELSACILPNNNDILTNNFLNDIDLATRQAQTHHLVNEDGTFASPEYLECFTADMRSSAIFAQQVLGIDVKALITDRLPYVISQIILKTKQPIPRSIAKKLTPNDIETLVLMAHLNEIGQPQHEKERDELIEKTIRGLPFPAEIIQENSEIIYKMQSAVRDSIWKTWKKSEQLRRAHKRATYLAIKQLLREFPDLEVLSAKLLGFSQ
jgi:hypothetical protein